MRKQSNRHFPAKAMVVWHRLDDTEYMCHVKGYLEEASNFRKSAASDEARGVPSWTRSMPWLGSAPVYTSGEAEGI